MEKLLKIIKEYQRPIRSIIWTLLISVTLIFCISGKGDCLKGGLAEEIIIGMFIDMGVYNFLRTKEKQKNDSIQK